MKIIISYGRESCHAKNGAGWPRTCFEREFYDKGAATRFENAKIKEASEINETLETGAHKGRAWVNRKEIDESL